MLEKLFIRALLFTLSTFRFGESFTYQRTTCRDEGCSQNLGAEDLNTESSKLLIILIDGFRWDYYTRQKTQLPGLSTFLAEGVHAEWVEPIFPSLSFPTWTTIATGTFPEEHNILGNYMLHRPQDSGLNGTSDEPDNHLSKVPEAIFSLKDNSTKSPFWWNSSSEPLWTTATKNNQKVFLANWARCDVPIADILPTECKGYKYQDVNFGFRDDLISAIKRLQKGYSLAMVYDDFIDHTGHQFGPDSKELKVAMIQRDAQIHELLMTMQLYGLSKKINVVITSDHGMTNLDKTVKRIMLNEYIDLDHVHRVIDYGPVVGISAMPNFAETLAETLKEMPGTTVYSKSEIPEEFHYKRGNFVPDFLLVAKPGYFIVGVKGEKQIPNDSASSSIQPYLGVHGYYDFEDMRTVFFAKGPAFKKGWTQKPFSVVDQYQIFMKILGIPPNPHHGKWGSIEDMMMSNI